MKSRFTAKIERIPETVAMLENLDTTSLEAALKAGRSRPAIAVGSGGSGSRRRINWYLKNEDSFLLMNLPSP